MEANEIRVLAATAMLGSGFLESSFEQGLRRKPHLIGCDSGSTDGGPFSLGMGRPGFSRDATKRDLRLMLLGARRLKVPLFIGSAGTAGGDINLQFTYEILKEIAAEEGLSFKLALIHSEQGKEYLKRRLREGRIAPLNNAPHIDEAVIDRSEHIVGMMGAEPFIRALEAGADVVLAGRSSDTAIYAGYPVSKGFSEGLSWHAAKILECGTSAATKRPTPDSLMAFIRRDHFVVETMDPNLICTPQSVAAHSLYENANAFELKECSGTLDLTESEYTANNDGRTVRVSGSKFIPSKYTVKLEGAEKTGYQSIIVGGVRDPYIIRQIDDWLARLKEKVRLRVVSVYGEDVAADGYVLNIRVYGKNGVMGPLEPVKEITTHEICLLFEVTAPSQKVASSIASITRHQALHLPIPEWNGAITAIALPYNPSYLERGAVYRFNLNHVVHPDDPYEMFPMELIDIGS
jgi:hypothetical protein